MWLNVQLRPELRDVSFLVNFLIRNENKQVCMLSDCLFPALFLTRILSSLHGGN